MPHLEGVYTFSDRTLHSESEHELGERMLHSDGMRSKLNVQRLNSICSVIEPRV